MSISAAPLKHAAAAVVRSPPVRRAAVGADRLRGRGLVLLWHRVRPTPAAATDVIPTVTLDRFRAQLRTITDLGEVVPLADLDGRDPSARPRFALTFDDDDAGHVDHALPVLRELGLPATFFLSGRWLHGRGPYWWEVLEAQLRRDGLGTVAARLGHPGATAEQLAGAIEGTPAADALAVGTGAPPSMSAGDAARLVDAGMEIGFHTVDHPVLPRLDDDAVVDAVTRGREELGRAVGARVTRLAYPHGKHDARVRAAVAEAGYASAWTTNHDVAHPTDDPSARGRWEPGPRGPEQLTVGILRRLWRTPPSAR